MKCVFCSCMQSRVVDSRPVSYTHRDVYKRQLFALAGTDLEGIVLDHARHVVGVDAGGVDHALGADTFVAAAAVSYTHLDVYKRQRERCTGNIRQTFHFPYPRHIKNGIQSGVPRATGRRAGLFSRGDAFAARMTHIFCVTGAKC